MTLFKMGTSKARVPNRILDTKIDPLIVISIDRSFPNEMIAMPTICKHRNLRTIYVLTYIRKAI